MSFNSLLVHTATTFRNLPNGTGAQKSYQQNLRKQPCMVQPLSSELAARLGMTYGKSYNLFVPLGTDIQPTDGVLDQDSKYYRITGSMKRNYGTSAPHATYLMVEEAKAIPDI